MVMTMPREHEREVERDSSADGEPVLPDRSSDDSDVGWGETAKPRDRRYSQRDLELLAERPPHWE